MNKEKKLTPLQEKEELLKSIDWEGHLSPKELAIFKSYTWQSIKNNPELQNSNNDSLRRAIIRGLQSGLIPNGIDAFFNVRNQRDAAGIRRPLALFETIHSGRVKIAWSSDKISSLRQDVVREKDYFHFNIKDGKEDLVHKKNFDEDNVLITKAYSSVTLTNKLVLNLVITERDLKEIFGGRKKRAYVWESREGEMWKKTAFSVHFKNLPIDQTKSSIALEDMRSEGNYSGSKEPEATPEEVAEKKPTKEPKGLIDALETKPKPTPARPTPPKPKPKEETPEKTKPNYSAYELIKKNAEKAGGEITYKKIDEYSKKTFFKTFEKLNPMEVGQLIGLYDKAIDKKLKEKKLKEKEESK